MMKGAVLFEIPSQEVKAKRLKANRKDYQSTSANTLQASIFLSAANKLKEKQIVHLQTQQSVQLQSEVHH